MTQVEKNSRNYVGYEYKEIAVESSKLSMYLDCYESFGWQLDERAGGVREQGVPDLTIGNRPVVRTVTLSLRRDRKIMNKQELTRLQRNFEDCMNQIGMLERSRTTKATMWSLIVGFVGTAFMAGSVFAITAVPPIIWQCILLAIPGFIGWAAAPLLYRHLVSQRAEVIAPMIEEKYDEIYGICEKGNQLLGSH